MQMHDVSVRAEAAYCCQVPDWFVPQGKETCTQASQTSTFQRNTLLYGDNPFWKPDEILSTKPSSKAAQMCS